MTSHTDAERARAREVLIEQIRSIGFGPLSMCIPHDRVQDAVFDAMLAFATEREEAAISRVGDGWQAVPVEPTRAMWAAGGNAVVGYKQRHHDKVVEAIWSAMLAAAQDAGADQ